MAGLLHTLTEKYDYMVLTEEILREISQTHSTQTIQMVQKQYLNFLSSYQS